MENEIRTRIHWLDQRIVRKLEKSRETNDAKSEKWPKTSIWAFF